MLTLGLDVINIFSNTLSSYCILKQMHKYVDFRTRCHQYFKIIFSSWNQKFNKSFLWEFVVSRHQYPFFELRMCCAVARMSDQQGQSGYGDVD
jgi:hypothetical protein